MVKEINWDREPSPVSLFSKGVHPVVKSAAKDALKAGKKYVVNQFKDAVCDSVLTTAVGIGVSKLAELYY